MQAPPVAAGATVLRLLDVLRFDRAVPSKCASVVLTGVSMLCYDAASSKNLERMARGIAFRWKLS